MFGIENVAGASAEPQPPLAGWIGGFRVPIDGAAPRTCRTGLPLAASALLADIERKNAVILDEISVVDFNPVVFNNLCAQPQRHLWRHQQVRHPDPCRRRLRRDHYPQRTRPAPTTSPCRGSAMRMNCARSSRPSTTACSTTSAQLDERLKERGEVLP